MPFPQPEAWVQTWWSIGCRTKGHRTGQRTAGEGTLKYVEPIDLQGTRWNMGTILLMIIFVVLSHFFFGRCSQNSFCSDSSSAFVDFSCRLSRFKMNQHRAIFAINPQSVWDVSTPQDEAAKEYNVHTIDEAASGFSWFFQFLLWKVGVILSGVQFTAAKTTCESWRRFSTFVNRRRPNCTFQLWQAEFEHYQQIEDAEREKKRKLKSEAGRIAKVATRCDLSFIKCCRWPSRVRTVFY